jgi:hypothetical protein
MPFFHNKSFLCVKTQNHIFLGWKDVKKIAQKENITHRATRHFQFDEHEYEVQPFTGVWLIFHIPNL